MSTPTNQNSNNSRIWIAVGTMGFAALTITALAIIAILKQPDETMTIFNIVLPVMASWVGTILAFYFGKENFESANKSVRDMIEKISPEQREQSLVKAIMRDIHNTVYFQFTRGKTDKDVTVAELRKLLTGKISRLLILDNESRPRYIIHDSRFSSFLLSGGKENDTLEKFIADNQKEGISFGLNKGFIIVSEDTTLGEAKKRLKEHPSCQDIFITKTGTDKEPLSGWISNIRMEKYFQ